MKFIVDELPYYEDECPFSAINDSICYEDRSKCPRYWDKEFICSNDNPYECRYLIEFEKYLQNTIPESTSTTTNDKPIFAFYGG